MWFKLNWNWTVEQVKCQNGKMSYHFVCFSLLNGQLIPIGNVVRLNHWMLNRLLRLNCSIFCFVMFCLWLQIISFFFYFQSLQNSHVFLNNSKIELIFVQCLIYIKTDACDNNNIQSTIEYESIIIHLSIGHFSVLTKFK